MMRVIRSNSNMTKFFSNEQCRNLDDGTKLVLVALEIEEFEVDYIWVNSTTLRSEEGNESKQFEASEGKETICEYIKHHDTDGILVTGMYNKKHVVVGYNNIHNELYITCRNKESFDVDALAQRLKFI